MALEVAGLGGLLGALVAFHGQRVLLFAADAPFGRNVLGRHAHVDGVEGVVQGANHHVHHLGVPHAGAPAHVQAGKGRAAHVFGATPNGDVGVAQQNALAGVDDGLQAGTAQAVHVVGRGAFATATVDGGHAAEVHVFGFGIHHVAKHHMAHVFAVYAGAVERLAYHLRGQFGGGNVFEAAAKGANGGAHSADDDDFTGHGDLLNEWVG